MKLDPSYRHNSNRCKGLIHIDLRYGSHCDDSYHSLANERRSHAYGSDHDLDLLVALVHGSDNVKIRLRQHINISLHKRNGF